MSEWLFFGGLFLSGITAAVIIIFFIFNHAAWKRLSAKLDNEYGERLS